MSCFITLEGPEGSGKSTHAKLLAEVLLDRGHDILLSREPGGSPIGDQIRHILMSLGNKEMHPETEFLLFSSSRAQHVRQIIQPHLAEGGIVVCDRYYHSSLAYQGYGHRLNLTALRLITQFATAELSPDLVLLFDLPIGEGLKRRRQDGSWNRLDDYDEAFHQRVREGYLTMAEEDPEIWVVIDADRPIDAIQEEVQSIVLSRLE